MNSGTPLLRPPLLRHKCGLSRGVVSRCRRVEINTFMVRFTFTKVAFSEGLASRQDGLAKEVPLYIF